MCDFNVVPITIKPITDTTKRYSTTEDGFGKPLPVYVYYSLYSTKEKRINIDIIAVFLAFEELVEVKPSGIWLDDMTKEILEYLGEGHEV